MRGATEINIPVGDVQLQGNLIIPKDAHGIVVFAHGSGSSRFSPRNQMVAKFLQEAGMGTLLMDLLTAEEEKIDIYTSEYRFDIEKLSDRLVNATDWLSSNAKTAKLNIGYFGSSTGGAAALIAASKKGAMIKAVVSRGGRPDLAGQFLVHVQTPTLLIVGGEDSIVIELNQKALDLLPCEKKLVIVPGATHLFEETGALETVSELSGAWFSRFL